jgi:hypothetical protein
VGGQGGTRGCEGVRGGSDWSVTGAVQVCGGGGGEAVGLPQWRVDTASWLERRLLEGGAGVRRQGCPNGGWTLPRGLTGASMRVGPVVWGRRGRRGQEEGGG